MLSEKLAENGQSVFLKALVIVFLIRIIISVWLPITGDEAYFVTWGKNLDYGYYDHTPFVGWLLAAFLGISDATWWLRLPSVLLPVFISYGIFRILEHREPQVAGWVALSFLVAPVNIVNVLITTDTPLVFFSFISAWYFCRAICDSHEHNKGYRYFILAGLFLGLAFFSKYFAVFLGVTYALYIMLFHRDRRSLTGLGLVLLMVLPFVFINLVWNYNNCWSNILFNLYNRTSGEIDILANLFKYIGILFYLFAPLLFFYVIKNRKQYGTLNKDKYSHLYLWMIGLPLFLFLLLLTRKAIGLHWLLSFYPFAFIAFSSLLNVKQWRITFYFMLILSSLHFLALATILTLPVNTFTADKTTLQNFSFGLHPQQLLNQLTEYEDDYVFSTVSYGMAAVASYYSTKDFIVFGEGSVHAREGDKITNFKELDGQNILFFKRSENYLDIYEKYCASSERKKIWIDNVSFELFLGKGFKYNLYREDILLAVNMKYYDIPSWLPVGQCGFKKKYNLD